MIPEIVWALMGRIPSAAEEEGTQAQEFGDVHFCADRASCFSIDFL